MGADLPLPRRKVDRRLVVFLCLMIVLEASQWLFVLTGPSKATIGWPLMAVGSCCIAAAAWLGVKGCTAAAPVARWSALLGFLALQVLAFVFHPLAFIDTHAVHRDPAPTLTLYNSSVTFQ